MTDSLPLRATHRVAVALAVASLLSAFALLQAPVAQAKLPPPPAEAQAKAAQAAARSAWSNKVANYQLCVSQDKVVARYLAERRSAGKPVPTAAEPPPCSDPGPFVEAPAERPIEASEAHSPAETATKPPSTTTPDAEKAQK